MYQDVVVVARGGRYEKIPSDEILGVLDEQLAAAGWEMGETADQLVLGGPGEIASIKWEVELASRKTTYKDVDLQADGPVTPEQLDVLVGNLLEVSEVSHWTFYITYTAARGDPLTQTREQIEVAAGDAFLSELAVHPYEVRPPGEIVHIQLERADDHLDVFVTSASSRPWDRAAAARQTGKDIPADADCRIDVLDTAGMSYPLSDLPQRIEVELQGDHQRVTCTRARRQQLDVSDIARQARERAAELIAAAEPGA